MKTGIALIVGGHQILEDVVRQYHDRHFSVTRISHADYSGESADELFIATEVSAGETVAEDMKNINFIRTLSKALDEKHYLRCHILLHSNEIMNMVVRDGLCDDLSSKIEILPFTELGLLARRVLAPLPGERLLCNPIDGGMIAYESFKTVHLVLFGMNDMSETFAEYAALTCHYPAYSRNHSLRTRITIVDDDMSERIHGFLNRYSHLFDNSFYRIVDLKTDKGASVTSFHSPQYDGEREDFVDIEWEFVCGGIWSKVLREKLSSWAKNERQLLAVALCHDTDDENVEVAVQLPCELSSGRVPVLIKKRAVEVSDLLSERLNLVALGKNECTYDINIPLVKLAKMVNHVYDCCYEDNYLKGDDTSAVFYPVSIDKERMEDSWRSLSTSMKLSNMYNAMTIPVKMRSVGLGADSWSEFYSLSSKEIAIIAEVEHNRWNVAELLLGYRPVDNNEEKEIEADISLKKQYKNKRVHYDIRAYNDLRADASGRNVNTYDICLSSAIPLIAKMFITD